ncbi:hypothetical protein C0J52_24817 [Blattella germanica]|nr:hypothetical protein C0J52_24817 [Blattella germanica]
MPPFVPVQSLYSSCLTAVFEHLFVSVQRSSNSVEHLRKVVQSSLHAGIREHLVHMATAQCRNNVYLLLDLLRILLDQAIKKLDHSSGDDNAWLRADQCAALLSTIEQCKATGLQDLTVKVRLEPRRPGDLETGSAANIAFHRLLRNGLATNLCSLILRSVCDNEILRLLGRLCPHLRNLDATSSWLVDDNGLRALCFKIHCIDLGMVAENCPYLEELGAKLEGGWDREGGEMLPHLAICRIRVGTTEPLQTLLVHAHRLEQLEVVLEEGLYGKAIEAVNDSVISQCLAENPRLEHLRVFIVRTDCYLTALSVQLLISSCPSLRIIGDFHFWLGISDQDIEELVQDINERNLDLMISYRGNLLPYRRASCFIAEEFNCFSHSDFRNPWK